MNATITLGTLGALALFTTTAAAQTIDVTAATRAYDLVATGYDYEFDDGVGASESTAALGGAWERDVSVLLDDYESNDLTGGRAFHESDLWSGGIVADLSCEAYSFPTYMYTSDAWSETEVDVTFEVHERVRYAFDASLATTDDGYSVAEVGLRGPSGHLAYARVWDGAEDDVAVTGWLEAGEYDLDALCEAVIIVSGTEVLHAVTDIALDLRVFAAADWDMDGDCDAVDKADFRTAWLAGSPSADFDGDGATDVVDWLEFRRAWRAAQASRPIDPGRIAPL